MKKTSLCALIIFLLISILTMQVIAKSVDKSFLSNKVAAEHKDKYKEAKINNVEKVKNTINLEKNRTITIPGDNNENTTSIEDSYIDSMFSDDNFMSKELKNEFNKSNKELLTLKSELKTWKKVFLKLNNEKYKEKKLSKERFEQLYDENYSLKDIHKANQLASICNLSTEEILMTKGKTDNYTVVIEKNDKGEEVEIIIDKFYELWDKAAEKLEIDLRKAIRKLGIPAKHIEYMEEQGMSLNKIYEIAIEAITFDEDYIEIFNIQNTINKKHNNKEVTKSKNQQKNEQKGDFKEKNKFNQTITEDKIKEFKINRINKLNKHTHKPELSSEEKENLILRTAYKITDAEISLCSEKGITKINDIAKAKHLAAKYNTTLEKVLNIREKQKDWEKTIEELEGSN